MKLLIILSSLVIGLGLGLFPSMKQAKPMWWKIVAVLLMTVAMLSALIPPIAGSFGDLKRLTLLDENTTMNVVYKILDDNTSISPGNLSEMNVADAFKSMNIAEKVSIPSSLPADDQLFKALSDKTHFRVFAIVATMKYDKTSDKFIYLNTITYEPFLVFPYIPGLAENIRIINFHVPVAWVTVLAYLLAVIYSIMYLRTKKLEYDTAATTSVALGTVFCILATLTGMAWAKVNWGAYWNWDPRETTIFVLLLIYLAYFVLRSALPNLELRARLSSVYAIVAFIAVPFLIFLLPRMASGLHPGSAGEGFAGPVIGSGDDTMNIAKQFTFGLGFASYTVIFFWLLNISLRLSKIFSKNNKKSFTVSKELN